MEMVITKHCVTVTATMTTTTSCGNDNDDDIVWQRQKHGVTMTTTGTAQ